MEIGTNTGGITLWEGVGDGDEVALGLVVGLPELLAVTEGLLVRLDVTLGVRDIEADCEGEAVGLCAE
jgi:hypothetical protein